MVAACNGMAFSDPESSGWMNAKLMKDAASANAKKKTADPTSQLHCCLLIVRLANAALIAELPA